MMRNLRTLTMMRNLRTLTMMRNPRPTARFGTRVCLRLPRAPAVLEPVAPTLSVPA
jgi:hypothetical protein